MISKRTGLILSGIFAAAVLLPQSYYTVKPSDMANVRRLGVARFEEPVGPGLHFKIPLIDDVDAIQVNLRTLHIKPFIVKTVDNQQITLDINFNYTVPQDKVNHLLYEVGKAGGDDIDSSIIPVAMDRASRVFALQNTTQISANRETIQKDVETKVFDAVEAQFGIDPHSLQIAGITLSDAFVTSNENAVRAKNDAVAEQNGVRVREAQAEQARIKSKGAAGATVEDARGASESTVIVAEAKKEALQLEGEGQAAYTQAGIDVFGSVEKYLEYLGVKAALKWDGNPPQVVAKGGNVTTVVVPQTPAPKAP